MNNDSISERESREEVLGVQRWMMANRMGEREGVCVGERH